MLGEYSRAEYVSIYQGLAEAIVIEPIIPITLILD